MKVPFQPSRSVTSLRSDFSRPEGMSRVLRQFACVALGAGTFSKER
jgi:hypothetical protein